MSIYTLESLKKKAAIIRTFLKAKCDLNISQGHSLELIAKINGFNDWNTAAAALKPKLEQKSSPVKIETVGDLKMALEMLDDSATITADYRFQLKEFEIDPDDDPEDEINQEFSIVLEELAKDMVSIKLTLEHEDITKRYSPTNENCGFFET